DRILADVANPHYEPGRLAGVVGPVLAGGIAQARLQATDFLAPVRECFLLLFLGLLPGFLHFQFQFPSGELGVVGVDAGVSKLLILNLELPLSVEGIWGYFGHAAALTCWSEFELQVVKLYFLTGGQAHVHRDVSKSPKKGYSSGADRLALASRYGG